MRAKWASILLLLLALSGAASADALEEGIAAVSRRDYGAALKLFKPLAEAGNVVAQVNLGNLYMKGAGVKQDYLEAGRWYLLAAEQNERMAQSKLGVMHYYGLGTEKNPAEAARWFTKAAQQGDRSAQTVLASLYAQGEGLSRDPAKAYYWYTLAAEQGSEDAALARKGLAEEMTPGEMDEALRLVGETRRKASEDAERELEAAVAAASGAAAGKASGNEGKALAAPVKAGKSRRPKGKKAKRP